MRLMGDQLTRSTSRQTAKVTHLQKGRPPREEANARRQERTDELLRASALVLARNGVRHTSMDALAEQLGIPKTVLYRYFGSKDESVRSILQRILNQWTELQSQRWRGLSHNLHEVIALARANQSEFLLLARHSATDPDLRPFFESLHSSIVDRTDKLLELSSPSMAKDKVIRQLCSQAVTGFMIDAVLWWIENGDKKRDDDFFRWARQSLNTLYRQWMPDSNWRPNRREDETLEDMLPSSA
jgi:AcrR family transcriptional regulator